MKTSSLTGKTITIVLLAEFVCAAAFSGTALLHERRTRLHAFDATLRGRSDSLLGAVQDAEDPEDNVAIDPAELSLPAEDAYAVYNLGGRCLGTSSQAPGMLVQRRGNGFSKQRFAGRRYRVYERTAMRVIDRAEYGGVGLKRPVTIVYAASTDRMWHEIDEAARFYGVLSLTLLTLTALFLVLMLRRVLQPIKDLAAQAEQVSDHSLDFEPPVSALQVKELQPLALALTTAIGGLRRALEHEKRFVSDASHELKTAVAVVRSTIQVLMLRSRTREEYSEGLERLLEDNRRVEDLVFRMLTLSRLETDAGSSCEASDLCVAVGCTVERLRGFAEANGVNLQTEMVGPAPVGTAAEKLEVLASNLIVNAIQHSPRETQVTVAVHAEAERILLRVRDRGAGIAAEALPHVFQRFYRADHSRSRETGGAGLGLAISKSVVDAVGGTISIESSPGHGTCVTVAFRVA